MITWNDGLATGLAEIDSQHQQLFDIAARLEGLHREGAGATQIAAVLRELKQYAEYHFKTEDDLMAHHALCEAHRSAHAHAHDGFVRQVERASALAQAEPESAVDLLLPYLAQWLLHHVGNMDRLMADEIKSQLAGAAPPQIADGPDARQVALIDSLNGIFSEMGDKTFHILELNLQLRKEIDRRAQIERELGESKKRFRTMADHTHSWEYWQGAEGQFIYMSPSCERMTGYAPDAFAADPDLMYRIIHPEDQHVMATHRVDLRHEEMDDEELCFRIIRRDGEVRWLVHSCKALYGANGEFIGRRGSNRDITDRRVQNDSMLLAATVFDAVNEAVLLTDAENRIILVNAAFTDISGYAADDVLGKDPGVLADEVPPPEMVREQWQKLTARGRWQGEMINRRKNGELYAARVSIDSVRDDLGQVSNYVLVFSDISESKENERRIEYLAHHDHLTGLPTWMLFNERARQAFEAVSQNDGQLALMFVDIDRYKQAKDRIGHDAGDLLLKAFADRLRSCLPPTALAARIGSDEFVVLLKDVKGAEEALDVSAQVLSLASRSFKLDDHVIQISASVGVALHPEHGDDIGQVMKNADLALYQAKQSGGATARLYSPSDWLA